MLPFARLFRSRWAALLWAGGIMWTAADFARSAPHPGKAPVADRASVDVVDLDALSNELVR